MVAGGGLKSVSGISLTKSECSVLPIARLCGVPLAPYSLRVGECRRPGPRFASAVAGSLLLDFRSSLISFARGHKLVYLGIYLAHSTPDVSFEQPTPVVVLDALGIAQRFFHRVADVVEPRKQLLHILMLVHRISLSLLHRTSYATKDALIPPKGLWWPSRGRVHAGGL